MREIKFRVWDKDCQRMHVCGENTHDNIIFSENGNAFYYNLQNGEGSSMDGSDDDSTYILMQFTGLKDKSGVEVYEGDIVQCVHWFFDGSEIDEHFVASVGFRDGSFTLENINSRYYSDYTGSENGKGVCWIGYINYCDEDYEVIGNVYQHSHLLKEGAI